MHLIAVSRPFSLDVLVCKAFRAAGDFWRYVPSKCQRTSEMPSRSLNARISAYKKVFASGEIQKTYQNLVGIVQKQRTGFAKKYKGEYSVANVQHGYIDFTYFYLQNDFLKNIKLKFAIVFNHQHANFELWLLGQTKDVQKRSHEFGPPAKFMV